MYHHRICLRDTITLDNELSEYDYDIWNINCHLRVVNDLLEASNAFYKTTTLANEFAKYYEPRKEQLTYIEAALAILPADSQFRDELF